MSPSVFPLDIQKRIIHFVLALTPSYPGSISTNDPVTSSWDSLAGQNGRQASLRRSVERMGIARAALNLMRVSKTWKVCAYCPCCELRTELSQKETIKYLYAEPYIHADNLFPLASALIRGDRKWDDLHLHPHSVPGRYITTLDLSHLHDAYYSIHSTSITRACNDIFQLVPNLTHLKLPNEMTPFDLGLISSPPFATSLKELEGLQVDYEESSDPKNGDDPVVRLLRCLPNLEVLSLHGPGDVEIGTQWEQSEQVTLKLDKLHTLILHGVKTGIALDMLIHAELPALRRLILTSYYQHSDDLTFDFQQAHGLDILSLTYLQTREWQYVQSVPASETLDWHPNLIHLSYLLPNNLSQLSNILSSASSGATLHPLRSLTLPKWNTTGTASPVPRWDQIAQAPIQPILPSQTLSDTSSRFLRSLALQPPPNLASISIDGFRWVRAELGMRALMTGDSGEMRYWSDRLRERGMEMRDMDGRVAPLRDNVPVEQVRGRRRLSVRAERVAPDELDEDGG